MRITDLKPAQIESFFKSRLQGAKFVKSTGGNFMTLCSFHQETSASLSVNFEKGVWRCFAGCGQGGLIDFEKKFSNCDNATALANIAELSGAAQLAMGSGKGPEFTWDYRDEFGKLVFQVLRYRDSNGKKKILQRRPCAECDNGKKSGCTNKDCKSGWVWKKDGTRKILYRLQEVITANTVILAEGEKCSDRVVLELAKLKIPAGDRIAVTTSPEGAGKWRDEYAPYFAGKKVICFPDNDEPGRAHMETAACSLSKYAAFVKVVPLPGLEPKEDIWDYFEHGHSMMEAFAEAKKVSRWAPAGTNDTMFISVADFVKAAPPEKDWVVDDLVEKGSNGFVIAAPKSGKSWATIDLAIAIASGQNWMGLNVSRVMKVAHFSREDNPDTTSWRYKQLLKRRQLHEEDVRDNIYLNTRRETPRFMLDEEEWVLKACADMKKLGTEFFILDVLNKMHGADENDNTEMREIINRVEFMAAQTGAQWCIVHHYSKRNGVGDEGRLTEMMRGASAIAGAAEWIVGFFMENEDWTDPLDNRRKEVRKAKFDSKAAQPPKPFYWVIEDPVNDNGIAIARIEYDSNDSKPKKGRKAKAAAAGGDEDV